MKILYICTHNRCRSILSEAITNHMSEDKFQAFSAGSQPAGEVHPLSIQYLKEKGISVEHLQSQSWDDFEELNPDIVITVCDSAAAETCPVWLGDTIKLHWSLPDPSKLTGTDEELRDAFFEVMDTIEQRVQRLLQLNLESLPQAQRQEALNRLVEE